MVASDELAAESEVLAAAEARMDSPRACRDCAHFCWLREAGPSGVGVCCVDRDGGGMGALYEADPDEDQAWEGGCDLWEPQRPARVVGIASRGTADAWRRMGLGDALSLGA